MGDTYQTIAAPDVPAHHAPRLAARVVRRLVAEGIVLAEAEAGWALPDRPAHPPGPRWHKAVGDARWGAPDGLVVHTERHVFHRLGTPRPDTVVCPRCGRTTTVQGDAEPRFHAAIGTWYETGNADVDCPACHAPVPLPAWTWTEDTFAFAHLGFEFWNWPALAEEFRTLVTGLLPGRRTVFLHGKL
ncbi:hypothetical protein AB0K80_03460 [Streptomyces sp. NPDC052682]|uniref:hypothetical protein n=1 Tax=Streptomyces sp. NPDC052682 TaxID=3154954 RepID=UPI0034340D5A